MSGRPKDLVWERGDNLAPGWRCTPNITVFGVVFLCITINY
jgi:hypothetical protein